MSAEKKSGLKKRIGYLKIRSEEISEAVMMRGEKTCESNRTCPWWGEKPTVAGGVDAFQKGTLGLETGDAVPLTVEHLQLGEDAGVELCQTVVPYVQLGHMSEQVRLIWDHTGDLVQPARGKQRLGCTALLSSISKNTSQDMDVLHSPYFYVLCNR